MSELTEIAITTLLQGTNLWPNGKLDMPADDNRAIQRAQGLATTVVLHLKTWAGCLLQQVGKASRQNAATH